MTSTTYLPSIEQGAKLTFEQNFYMLQQQMKSKLVGAGIAKFVAADGKTHNMGRLGRTELVEVTGRNPDKQYSDYSIDNRQFTKRRFTRTFTLDAKDDINELLKDPTSDLLSVLKAAQERVVDRMIIGAGVDSVLVGRPDRETTSISASADGVITVDASSGLTYEKIQEITQNFNNNELEDEMIRGAVFAITGKENSALMGEPEFISNDYISGRPVENGFVDAAGVYRTIRFAGSVNGGITVANPVLPEASTTRSCVVLAPQSVALATEIASIGLSPNNSKVNSTDITIDFWIGAMRTEGAKVQIVTTTM